MTVGVSSAQSTFYCVTLGDAFVRTGLCAEAIYYFPFITDIPQNYGTAYIAPTVYGATWHAEENGDGRFYFDGQPTASGTPIEDHDLVWMGTRLPGFPMGDFTIAASFAASNDNAVIGSGADEQWSKEWFLSRNMFCWAHQKGTSSGGRNKEFVEVTWNGVPYGVDTTVAITRSGSNVVTYVNGQEIPHSLTNYTFTGFYVRTPLPPHVLPSDTLPVYSYGMMIGNTEWGSPSQNWRPFQGYIDNVAIFDRVLDNNEIEILYAELRDEGSSN